MPPSPHPGEGGKQPTISSGEGNIKEADKKKEMLNKKKEKERYKKNGK